MSLATRLIAKFGDMPIRQKLKLILIVTTATALLLAGVGIVAADSVLFYGYLQRDLATFVKVIGDNSTGALSFNDPRAGTEALAALRARTHVEAACLYYNSGALLAKYVRPDSPNTCPEPAGDSVRRQNGALAVSHDIILADRPVGTVTLRYDLGEIVERVWLYGATVLGTLLISCLLALLLSAKLRAMLAAPILELAGAANAVAHTKDYSLRTKKLSEDEVGELAEAINQMLETIQSRDSDLRTALEAQQDAVARLAQLNADLRHSNTELARSNQDLERFAFVASHDLQEPLRMITSYSQLLVAEYSAASKETQTAEFVEHIVGGTRRMRELLADLLAYTEIAGSSEQPPAPVDLNLVLERVTQTFAVRIKDTGTEVIAGKLPVVMAHEGRLSSLFQNLIGNAIKYRGAQPPRIRISACCEGEEFLFSVADNGIGISNEYHDRIFAAFKRLHGRSIPGTGIGLAICQRIVERYGGRIWVESELGAGSTFHFTLPKTMAGELKSDASSS